MDGPLNEKIPKFLFSYRITPQTSTGRSPAELLLGKRPRSRFDLIQPDMSIIHPLPKRAFSVGDKLFAKNYSGTAKWIPVTVTKITGPLSYHASLFR